VNLATRVAPAHAHGSATASASETTIDEGVSTNAGGSVHKTPPRRADNNRAHSSLKRNHCCARGPRLSQRRLVQLARAQLPEIQDKASAQHTQELRTLAAHNASQLRGASVVTCPSFLAESWQTSGGSRPL